jgi:type III pantothenate kinase
VILDIDAGNGRIKWRLTGGLMVPLLGSQTTDSVRQGQSLALPETASVVRARLSSVAGDEVAASLASQLAQQFSIDLRWLAAIAAFAQVKNTVVVVDAGSAATIDIVVAPGRHLGGYIVPGMRLMHDALWQGTSRVKAEARPPEDIDTPGMNTNDAVNRGCLLILVAAIEKLVAQYQGALVITGGDGPLLMAHFSERAVYVPDLVLDGMALDGVGLRPFKATEK